MKKASSLPRKRDSSSRVGRLTEALRKGWKVGSVPPLPPSATLPPLLTNVQLEEDLSTTFFVGKNFALVL